jgi:hypothetical protein
MSHYNDLPREELLRAADRAIMEFTGANQVAQVRFKFTCEKCQTRCTFTEPNMLFETGDCSVCGHTTVVKEGGFLMEIKIGGAA